MYVGMNDNLPFIQSTNERNKEKWFKVRKQSWHSKSFETFKFQYIDFQMDKEISLFVF